MSLPPDRVPLFPLHLVLFPEGPLPLRVFEPRYLSMVSDCLRQDRPFGVVLITQGSETGEVPRCHPVGTLARIRDWDQGEDGLLHISAVGERRFRVRASEAREDRLLLAEIDELPERALALPDRYRPQAEWLMETLPRLEAYAGLPRRPDDANWVAFRLAELLLKPSGRQVLLEQDDPLRRLELVARQVEALRRD